MSVLVIFKYLTHFLIDVCGLIVWFEYGRE